MTIRFRCKSCNLALTVNDDRAGAKFKCPKCGLEDVIPAGGTATPAAGATSQPDRQKAAAAAPSQTAQPPEPPDAPEPIRFGNRRTTDEGVDMTPMVDVTFLLLIFFMVTAAYSMQKSIQVPAPDQEENAAQTRIEDIEENDDYVIIRIAKDNTVWVDEREAPSEQEVLVILREAREGGVGSDSRGPSSLLVMADREARHETVVMALDAGNAVGMENVKLACVDEEEF